MSADKLKRQRKVYKCPVCHHGKPSPIRECSHVDCPNRSTVTAAPPQDTNDYFEGCGKTPMRGVSEDE